MFDEGLERGVIDRPVEIVFREVEGLPKGTVKAVDRRVRRARRRGLPRRLRAGDHRQLRPDARGDRAALPGAGDQRHRHRRLARRVDVLAAAGLDDRRADLLGAADREGRARDQSACSSSSRWSARPTSELPARRVRAQGIRIVAEEPIAQTAQDVTDAVAQAARGEGRTRSCTAASGSASLGVNAALRSARLGSAALHGHRVRERVDQPDLLWQAMMGWTGLDQYDEGNPVGQQFLDEYEAAYGRRPEYCVPVVNRDLATVLLHAFADAHPLTPARGQGGARAGEDGAGGVGRAGHTALVRQVDAPGLDGRRATSSRGRSTPTARLAPRRRFGEV